jgi:catechol 2,3-dioxygenase-like lactoylglutathione lyase family enzyme
MCVDRLPLVCRVGARRPTRCRKTWWSYGGRATSKVEPMPQLNAIGIVTSEMARSIRFYRLLGLDVPETPDEGHVDTFLPNGVRFMLDSEDTVRSFRPDWVRETGNQLALAFECESASEVDDVYARMVEAGFDGEKEPWDAFWGQRYAQLRDPDGVGVDLYASL